MKKVKILFLIIMTVFSSSCQRTAPRALKPMSWLFDQMPKDAPENFKRGWEDGCESGLGNMTNSFYRTFYAFKQDPVLRQDPVYYETWKDTYTFCRHYAYGTIRQSDVRMKLPNAMPSTMERFAEGQGMFTNGLNLWGPGRANMLLENFGQIGGAGTTGADMYLSGPEGVVDIGEDYWTWDYDYFQ